VGEVVWKERFGARKESVFWDFCRDFLCVGLRGVFFLAGLTGCMERKKKQLLLELVGESLQGEKCKY